MNQENEKISNILAGISGEYFVAAELSRRGFITTLTLKNTKGVDILASDEDAKKTVAIQVKTTTKNKNEWMLSEKSENFVSDNHFYILVRLNEFGQSPSYHIVPSNEVAEDIKASHQKWLATPAKDGSVHKSTSMRIFKDLENKYKDRWDLLN